MCNECFLLLVPHLKKKLDCSVWWCRALHGKASFQRRPCTWNTTEPTMLGQPTRRGVLLLSKVLVPLAPSLLLHLQYRAVSEQMKKQLLYNICSVPIVSYFCSWKASGITILPSHTQTKRVYHKKRASAEDCKVYLCSLTQDPNFIKLYKISIDSVSPYHWILIAAWPKVNYTFKMNREKDIMQSTGNYCYLITVHQNILDFQCRCSAVIRVTVI